MSDPVLDTIDHVLHDFDTSPDAMRWTETPVSAEARCEDCWEGIAHQHPNGDLMACRSRCPGCIYCPRGDDSE